MTQDPDLRAGFADRERVIDQLTEAAGQGRITQLELEERIEAAQSAKTFGDLGRITRDLGEGPLTAAGTVAQYGIPGPAPIVPAPGYSPNDPLFLNAGMSTVTRTGRWQIPPYLLLHGSMGTIKLDCRQAIPQAPVIQIGVRAGIGGIIIVVPQGWAANIDRLTPGWGSAKSSVPTEPTTGSPLLVLSGGAGGGSVKVRTQRWWDKKV